MHGCFVIELEWIFMNLLMNQKVGFGDLVSANIIFIFRIKEFKFWTFIWVSEIISEKTL